ncbi:Fe-S protein assembly co-chaperone HscB [Pedobacter sp. ASV28]|uniref:Fe-S protein assembly co-chaperone HscB n=1 Tax=Pedobacter sp. ASV28 TaxID=2795123 RepID=UPI0018EA3734|nr:Fe-S protein assembly co-chaperone HscB [Pedobacter sp. ASV28]
MNYFELYGLPITFHPDQNVVKQQFYALSKKYHPDFYIKESQEKQEEVLERSTLNNKAFQVLKDPARVLQYVLELKGVITEGEHYVLPQSFLMDMMEVNETLMELEFDEDQGKLDILKKQIAQIEQALNQELEILTKGFHYEGDNRENILKAIKDLYYRNKYLRRITESLAKFGK